MILLIHEREVTNMAEKILDFIILLVILGFIASIVVMIKYANTPMSDVPLWVAWLLFNK